MDYNTVIIDSIEEIYKNAASKGTTWYNSSDINLRKWDSSCSSFNSCNVFRSESFRLPFTDTYIIAKIYQII